MTKGASNVVQAFAVVLQGANSNRGGRRVHQKAHNRFSGQGLRARAVVKQNRCARFCLSASMFGEIVGRWRRHVPSLFVYPRGAAGGDGREVRRFHGVDGPLVHAGRVLRWLFWHPELSRGVRSALWSPGRAPSGRRAGFGLSSLLEAWRGGGPVASLG